MSSLASFPYAVFFFSVTSSKCLHLYVHSRTVPIADFILYLPSFFVPDVIILSLARLLLRRERTLLSLLGLVVGCLLTIVTLGAASSQWGFWLETGGEVEWKDAASFAHDTEGMKVLLSGCRSVLAAAAVILVLAWLLKAILYKVSWTVLTMVGQSVVSAYSSIRSTLGLSTRSRYQPAHNDSTTSTRRNSTGSEDASDDQALLQQEKEPSNSRTGRLMRFVPSWLITAAILVFVGVTTICRPSKPYNHMSTTLPIPLLDVFKAAPDPCAEQTRLATNQWPLPELIQKSKWAVSKGHFKGWAPRSDSSLVKKYRKQVVDWLPSPVPSGFMRWDPKRFEKPAETETGVPQDESDKAEKRTVDSECPGIADEKYFYNPVNDPMRITNLDDDILKPLQHAINENSVKIKHVALILMESVREELFPIQQGSDIHKFIMDSYDEPEKREEVNFRVSRMTPNIEKLTGKPGNFHGLDGNPYPAAETEWKDQTPEGFGGINIVGAFTPSSVSTKSVAASHCGAWPMPVDKFEEAETESYQPCIPQVLEMFNRKKGNSSANDDFRSHQWYPAFFQSVTDEYDRQAKFDDKIGFKHIVTKNRLHDDLRDNYAIKEVNYFGYPETVLDPYIRDYISNATANNQRMFLSHFTSSTHHPWGLPDSFNSTSYMRTKNDFDKYLNTMRWTDAWLGQLMQIFEETGIANETLVVFLGDHGQAFKEDVSKTGTYENPHVSNYRVPITFRHPNLPRVQYNANATSISILPTILDLLINTGSLDPQDTEAASDLIHDYEGQSLIRPYKVSENGRRAWNFGVVNSGGGMLTITSADAPWRLVIPLDQDINYTFTDLKNDPLEKSPVSEWAIKRLVYVVSRKYGREAAEWVGEAEVVARWWATERKRLWNLKSEVKNDAKSVE